jgi:hypothetical protein
MTKTRTTRITIDAHLLVALALVDEATDRLSHQMWIVDHWADAAGCSQCGRDRERVGVAAGGWCFTCAVKAAEAGTYIRPRLAVDCCPDCNDLEYGYTPLRWEVDGGVLCTYRCDAGHSWHCSWSFDAVTEGLPL